MIKTVVKPYLKSQTYCESKSYIFQKEKKIFIIDSKFYQILFVVLISLSTFLIFPESPKKLEKICESYNSKELCNVW